jgi:hypothetical protein
VEPVFLAVEAKHLRWPGSRIRALLCHAFLESFAANLWHGLSGSYSWKSEISAKDNLNICNITIKIQTCPPQVKAARKNVKQGIHLKL